LYGTGIKNPNLNLRKKNEANIYAINNTKQKVFENIFKWENNLFEVHERTDNNTKKNTFNTTKISLLQILTSVSKAVTMLSDLHQRPLQYSMNFLYQKDSKSLFR